MKRKILIAGHGYLGGHLCRSLPRDTFEITVTTRDPSTFRQPVKGVNLLKFDVTNPHSANIHEPFDDLVYCIGYDRTQPYSRYDVYCSGMKHFLSKLTHPPDKFIYISSTGVYGNTNSGWIDETTLENPGRESGKACLAAEKVLRQSGLASKLWILRFAGIYGPGRIPNRKKLQSDSLEIPVEGQLNLIHVSDGANIITSFLESDSVRHGQRIFNVSDGNPVDRRLFYNKLAKQMGIKTPQFAPPAVGGKPDRMASSKKISNRRLVNETGYQFEFPDYQSGLNSILEQEKWAQT